MPITVEQAFDAMAPQFKESSDKTVFFGLASLRTSLEFYGDRYNLAVALRAAHMMELANRGGTSGMVSAHSEGDLSESFAAVGSTESDLSQTSFGSMLISLRSSSGSGTMVTGSLVGGCP